MADSWDQFEFLLRDMSPMYVVNGITPEDDVLENLIPQMQPENRVSRRSPLSTTDLSPAGYEAKWAIKVQRGGSVLGGSWAGNTLNQMGKDSHLTMGQAADQLFPDPRAVPMPSWIQCAMYLQIFQAQIALNYVQIRNKLLSEPVEDVTMGYLEDITARARRLKWCQFYGDGTGTLAQVNNGGGYSITETAGGVEVTIDAGTFARFGKGDRVVAGSDADPRVQRIGSGTLGKGRMYVVEVFPDTRKIWLQSAPGEGTITLSDNDHLMHEGTYDFGAATVALGSKAAQGVGVAAASGLLRNSGVFPGSVDVEHAASGRDVAYYAVLKSYIDYNSGTLRQPTPGVLARLVDKMLSGKKARPPVHIAERSLWTLYCEIEQAASAMQIVPQGGVFQANGGVAGPVLDHQGHKAVKLESDLVAPNTILGLDPSTFLSFMPMGSDAINWVYGSGPMSNNGSIFRRVDDGVQGTGLLEATGEFFYQFGCKDPCANFRAGDFQTARDA